MSRFVSPPCPTCGKRVYRKCLAGTSGCYDCGKNYHKGRHCPTIADRGRESKKALSEGTILIPPNYGRFYALHANKEENLDEGSGEL